MKKIILVRLLAGLCVALMATVSCWAQTGLKELTIEYNKTYQIDADYSIIFDNPEQPAKLNTFKVEFYAPDLSKIGETRIEAYPLSGTTEIYSLPKPIVGFNAAKLIILSLHEGDISSFPSNANAVLALNEISEVVNVQSTPSNAPPTCRDISLQVIASSENLTKNISGNYSDPDGDVVTVMPKSLLGQPLSYTLESDGTLIINSPSTIGTYDFLYEVEDSEGATASANIIVEVTLPQSIKNDLADSQTLLEQIQSLINKKETEAYEFSNPDENLAALRDELLTKNQALYESATRSKSTQEKQEVYELSIALEKSKSVKAYTDKLEALEARYSVLLNTLQDIQSSSSDDGVTIQSLQSQITQFKSNFGDLSDNLNSLDIPASLTTAQIESWQQTHLVLAAKISKSDFPISLLIGIVIGATILVLAAWFLLRRPKSESSLGQALQSQSSELGRPERPPESGVVFANSPLVAGVATAGPTPLAPLGQMVPSGLQTLTGQYAVLKPGYLATGRIGGPQEGVPTNDDVAFGTGFLITPNHIMTNQHVYEFYKHYLTGEDCGGIEFIAERDRDASDYVAFNGEPPLIIPDLDIAIFTLARSVTDRTPIDRVAIPTDTLDAREVVTISYPCPFEVDETILSVVEKDPVFAVKRLSQGHIFRHSTDTDTPYGVEVKVDTRINPAGALLAICHNASTLGGSSGAPILDLKGQLVGVHFAGDRAFGGKEAANLAMAIENLIHVNPS